VYPATIKNVFQFNDHTNTMMFFPHLTMEDPPNLHQHITDLIFINNILDPNTSVINWLGIGKAYWDHVISQLEKLKYELSLNLYITKF
jgi:hypothetical protein